jgi:hypothetical protein
VTASMGFTTTSRQVAEELLQTVLVVDDRAFRDRSDQNAAAATPQLIVPGRAGSEPVPPAGGGSPPLDVETPAEPDAEEDLAHEFDADKLVSTFSAQRMFCSVLSPEATSWPKVIMEVPKIAGRADMVILDWVLNPGGTGEGRETLELINAIIAADHENHASGRLRLIAIYTGTPDLDGIVEAITRGVAEGPHKLKVEQLDAFSLQVKNVLICVFAKEHARIPAERGDLHDRKQPIGHLPDVLVAEFARLTAGIVSNTAVRALTVLRENAFRLLSTFHRDLDAPFLEHRVLLKNPEDAQTHLVSLLASEIESILDGYRVGDYADVNAIDDWIREKLDEGSIDPSHLFQREPVSAGPLRGLVESGVDSVTYPPELKGLGNNAHKKEIAKAFVTGGADPNRLTLELAALTVIKNRYSTAVPHLTLGSLLRSPGSGVDAEKDEYWLCLQPRCDSVRIDASRPFPLIPMKVVSDSGRCHMVIKDPKTSDYLALQILYEPYRARMVEFATRPDETTVVASRENRLYYFESVGNLPYEWLGELRFEQAQRVAQTFATKLSRVGLDESEWLRRMAPP